MGYFTMENFMEGGSDGSVQSGLTYELLCEIGTYNHWNIEYVYGDIAVEKMKNAEPGQYDLILMDIQMPKMNGHTSKPIDVPVLMKILSDILK